MKKSRFGGEQTGEGRNLKLELGGWVNTENLTKLGVIGIIRGRD